LNQKSKYISPIWTPERNQWLIENTKGLARQEAYDLFCQKFPEVRTTIVALSNQRSRLRCSQYERAHSSTQIRPLYSEHEKKGYLFVKVAMPSTWWSKAKWVYVATHPEEAQSILEHETDAYYFADGNNRNFKWDNIIRLHRNEQGIFQCLGGVVPGHPELTRIHVAQARLKLAQLDAAEKCGDVVKHGTSSYIRKDLNAKADQYRKVKYKTDPAYRQHLLERQKLYRKNWTPEQRAKRNEYNKAWAKRKREKARLELQED